jgi:hypothetical protein
MTWTDTGLRGASTGTFTASPPLCPSGTYRDFGGIIGIKIEHTCADGSGVFNFEAAGKSGFHFGAGSTGRYTTLRGAGGCSVTQNDDGTFTRPCHALADFDNVAPTGRIGQFRIARSGRADTVRITFETSDNVDGNAVAYKLSATASGRELAHRSGSTAGGATKVTFRVKPPKRSRRLNASLHVSDPLGNSRTVVRSVRIPR